MFKLFSCKALLCFAVITVLLLLVEYRYAFFGDYLHLDFSDNRDVVVAANNETTFDEERNETTFDEERNETTFDNKTTFDEEHPKRYVISREYWEQQTMAVNNMFTLVWFCKYWNASVIAPYVERSSLYGIGPGHPLDLLYDRSQLNSVLESYQLPPLVPMETFLSEAKRNLIVFVLFYNGQTLYGNYPDVVARFSKTYVFECSDMKDMKKKLVDFVKELNRRSTNPFVIQAYYCVNASHAIHPDKIAEIIGIQGERDVSVVFSNWRGLSPSNGTKATALGKLKNYRMFVPELKNAVFPYEDTVALPYSSYVKGNASNFLRSLNVGEEFVVVHLRSEKLGIRDGRIKGYFTQCWEEVLKVLREEILSKHPNITVLYFTDYGPLGSKSCGSQCKGATSTNAALAKNGLKVSRFDPAKFNAVSESGFVALVEQCAMSMSKYIVLAGDGSFQTQIRQQFLSQPTAKRGYTVCWNDTIAVSSFE